MALEAKLTALGFHRHQVASARGLIIRRLVCPASELATHQRLGQRSGWAELLEDDFTTLDVNRRDRVSDGKSYTALHGGT